MFKYAKVLLERVDCLLSSGRKIGCRLFGTVLVAWAEKKENEVGLDPVCQPSLSTHSGQVEVGSFEVESLP